MRMYAAAHAVFAGIGAEGEGVVGCVGCWRLDIGYWMVDDG